MSTITPAERTEEPVSAIAPAPNGTPASKGEPRPTGERPGRSRGVAAGLAALRLTTGFIFLWAFLDKTFGLAYATQSEGSWINGGSPTEGFLGSVAVGPFESTFHNWAGDVWADWLFMLGLLGIGVAVMAGVGLRIAAVSGTLMMALMWAAEWPLARHTSTGELSMANNPLVDYHVIYAVTLIVVALTHAGDHYGFGRFWAHLPLVRRYGKVLQ